ncbi:hypothetical protein EIP91_003358 [Steccherinum ochraceum]|uniref:Protein YOP1 n=1 Tax=Steccherinum ochraceum TaxID=92696 RepID=A0A4R0RAP7_9APHY|nr:hypothetical protein EIP91_003358 [Steccherinum ochraceum]
MLLSFVFRVLSAVVAFLYPGYASYKTLSQRPASEIELERWLMYWSVLGCLVAVEYVAEWVISWIPFYYLMKTLFLFYLALPQTNGASFLYKTQVEPFFSAHEHEIDSALVQLKSHVYNYLQELLRSMWGHVASTLGQMPNQSQPANALDEGGLTGEAAVNAGAPPSLGDPVSGPAQLAQTFWRSYGPSFVASGAALFHQAQNAAAASAARQQTTPPGPSRANSSQSVQERRRQLEAELASLSEPSVQPYDVGSPSSSPVLIPAANNPSRVSSSSSLRGRSGSGNGRSTFEEVEVPSDMEGEGHAVPASPGEAKKASWFGWGGATTSGRGNYERVKTD